MDKASKSRYYVALADSVPFKGLDVPIIDAMLERGLVLEARGGDNVYFENMRGGLGLYVVLEGEVEIYRSAGGTDQRLSTLGSGHCFGEFSLIDGLDSSASARALTQSSLFFLPRGVFQQLVEGDAVIGRLIYYNLLRLLIQRMRAV